MFLICGRMSCYLHFLRIRYLVFVTTASWRLRWLCSTGGVYLIGENRIAWAGTYSTATLSMLGEEPIPVPLCPCLERNLFHCDFVHAWRGTYSSTTLSMFGEEPIPLPHCPLLWEEPIPLRLCPCLERNLFQCHFVHAWRGTYSSTTLSFALRGTYSIATLSVALRGTYSSATLSMLGEEPIPVPLCPCLERNLFQCHFVHAWRGTYSSATLSAAYLTWADPEWKRGSSRWQAG